MVELLFAEIAQLVISARVFMNYQRLVPQVGPQDSIQLLALNVQLATSAQLKEVKLISVPLGLINLLQVRQPAILALMVTIVHQCS